MHGVHTSYGTGDSIKSLVANNESVFKILTFRTYQKTVKITDSQLKKVRKLKGDEFWNRVQVRKPTPRN